MPAGAARRTRAPGAPAQRSSKKRGRGTAAAVDSQSLEHRILLTATMCLLAFGAVMVYSASSATTLLQGRGNGSCYLIKYVVYGAIGLVVMRVLARDGVAKVQSITAPLLIVSFVLVLAVHVPHVGVSVNGARRWIGPGSLQFQPSELLKLALVLYAATLLARRPQRVHDLRELFNPLLLVVGAAACSSAPSPTSARAMVIAFTTAALLLAAGIPPRKLAIVGGVVLAMVFLYALARPYARARLTSFIDPWAHAGSSGFQAVQGQIAIGSGGLFGVGPGRVGAEDLLPAGGAHGLHPRGDRRGAGGRGRVCAAVPLRADRLRRAARGEGRPQPLQRPDRGRRDGPDRLPGAVERVRRARPRAADGRRRCRSSPTARAA